MAPLAGSAGSDASSVTLPCSFPAAALQPDSRNCLPWQGGGVLAVAPRGVIRQRFRTWPTPTVLRPVSVVASRWCIPASSANMRLGWRWSPRRLVILCVCSSWMCCAHKRDRPRARIRPGKADGSSASVVRGNQSWGDKGIAEVVSPDRASARRRPTVRSSGTTPVDDRLVAHQSRHRPARHAPRASWSAARTANRLSRRSARVAS